MKFLLVAVFILLSGSCFAQSSSKRMVEAVQESVEGEGTVTIHQEEGINFLLDTQVDVNKRMAGVDGYRIQLYSGSGPKGKRQAMEVKGKLLDEFPDEAISTTYTAPWWRVRVGNYRHKHEALPLLNSLKEFFPNCYVVKDSEVKMKKFDRM
ncbi:SPOR domain-containing protein [Carboxylicivirga sp. N1Y90]|uniref:SPOR domain-containing protein n=1 Tax=Carboxylicivirga fragile TaxID=3417571 RepID=UPI003D356A86|nr:SPOR domain-containing protein [Marinilabiliaceae bacterium N1Y90]